MYRSQDRRAGRVIEVILHGYCYKDEREERNPLQETDDA